MCSADPQDRAPTHPSSTFTSFLWLHVDFLLTAHGRHPAEAAAAELHGVLVNWQFFWSGQICSTMHIFLNVPCSIWAFLLFSKCPLIGCTVTVSCFKRPMWHLKVAYLTPTPCGEETSYSAAKTNERGRFVVSILFFSILPDLHLLFSSIHFYLQA